jgi:hypothetical protein
MRLFEQSPRSSLIILTAAFTLGLGLCVTRPTTHYLRQLTRSTKKRPQADYRTPVDPQEHRVLNIRLTAALASPSLFDAEEKGP